MLADDLAYSLTPSIWAEDLKLVRDLKGNPSRLDPWQRLALDSGAQRIVLCCSRQSGKSSVCALMALHTCIFQPGALVLLISRSIRQSAELFMKFVTFLERLPDPPARTEDTKLSTILENGSRCVSLPSSEATIRGFSAVSLLIEDEASRVSDDIFVASAPMLSVSRGRQVLLSTPFGKAGHFYKIWTEENNWLKIQIKADQCPRLTPEILEEQMALFGPIKFAQEHNCEFIEDEFIIFTDERIERAINDDIEEIPI